VPRTCHGAGRPSHRERGRAQLLEQHSTSTSGTRDRDRSCWTSTCSAGLATGTSDIEPATVDRYIGLERTPRASSGPGAPDAAQRVRIRRQRAGRLSRRRRVEVGGICAVGGANPTRSDPRTTLAQMMRTPTTSATTWRQATRHRAGPSTSATTWRQATRHRAEPSTSRLTTRHRAGPSTSATTWRLAEATWGRADDVSAHVAPGDGARVGTGDPAAAGMARSCRPAQVSTDLPARRHRWFRVRRMTTSSRSTRSTKRYSSVMRRDRLA
jgi:hypothetical protein